MLFLMWPRNNCFDDNYVIKDILRGNGVRRSIAKGIKCYKESKNYIKDSSVPSCIPSIVCYRQLKYKKTLKTPNVTGKNPQVYLIKLNILEGDEVLVKQGKLYVHRKDLHHPNGINRDELCTLRSLKGKHIIVKSGKIYVEYTTTVEHKQHVLKTCPIERNPVCLANPENKLPLPNSSTRVCTTNQELGFVDTTPSVKHSSTSTSDMCKINKTTTTGQGKDLQCNSSNLKNCSMGLSRNRRSNLKTHKVPDQTRSKSLLANNLNIAKQLTQNRSIYNILSKGVSGAGTHAGISNIKETNHLKAQIPQNNCKVIFRKMEDNVDFMKQLGLRPIWEIREQPACKSIKSKFRKVKNEQNSKVMLKKLKHINNKKETLQNCKVVLKRLGIVEQRKFLENVASCT